MDEHRIIMRLGACAPQDHCGQWYSHGHEPIFSGTGNQTRHRIRRMDAIIQQLKVEHSELTRIWKQARKESGKGSRSVSRSRSKSPVENQVLQEMQIEPETQAGLMRTITALKQNLCALRRLGHRQIEAVAWSGVAVIEKDVQEIESFLCEFLCWKYRPGGNSEAEE